MLKKIRNIFGLYTESDFTSRYLNIILNGNITRTAVILQITKNCDYIVKNHKNTIQDDFPIFWRAPNGTYEYGLFRPYNYVDTYVHIVNKHKFKVKGPNKVFILQLEDLCTDSLYEILNHTKKYIKQ